MKHTYTLAARRECQQRPLVTVRAQRGYLAAQVAPLWCIVCSNVMLTAESFVLRVDATVISATSLNCCISECSVQINRPSGSGAQRQARECRVGMLYMVAWRILTGPIGCRWLPSAQRRSHRGLRPRLRPQHHTTRNGSSLADCARETRDSPSSACF